VNRYWVNISSFWFDQKEVCDLTDVSKLYASTMQRTFGTRPTRGSNQINRFVSLRSDSGSFTGRTLHAMD
jgi:hypothetical protein